MRLRTRIKVLIENFQSLTRDNAKYMQIKREEILDAANELLKESPEAYDELMKEIDLDHFNEGS